LTDYALLTLEERSGHRAKIIVPASHIFDVEAVLRRGCRNKSGHIHFGPVSG
jgi:hypothetical protein